MNPALIHVRGRPKNPTGSARASTSWRRYHPDWTIREWDEVELRAFLAEREPGVHAALGAIEPGEIGIVAAEASVLKHLGGLFADADVQCLKPFGPFLHGAEVVIGLEPRSHAADLPPSVLADGHPLGPSLFGGRAGHPFWDALLAALVEGHADAVAPEVAACVALGRAYAGLDDNASVRLLPAGLVSPIDRAEARSGAMFDIAHWELKTRSAAALNHWSGIATWTAPPRRFGTTVSGPTGGEHWAIGGEPLVSCLMVTRDRPEQAWLAVQCFLRQTYRNRELVVVDDGADDALARRLAGLPNVRHLGPDGTSPTIGRARNRAVAAAAGLLVCQWDDDDLYDPLRLEVQVSALRQHGARACLLDRWLIWWPETMRLAVSRRRPWEGSLLCDKAVLPTYPELSRGEDTPVVEALLRDVRTVTIDAPRLYLYIAHGRNTFAPAHFEAHWMAATDRFEGERGLAVLNELARRLPIADYAAMGSRAVAVAPSAPPRGPNPLRDAFEMRREQARSLADRGNLAGAAQAYGDLRAQWPERPDGFAGLALVAALGGDWIAAIARWDEVVVLFPDHVPGLLGRAHALTELGRFDEADAVFSAAARLHDARHKALVGLARNAQQACLWPDALARWDAVLALHPGDAVAHVGRVRSLLALGRVEEGERHAIAHAPALDREDQLILQCMLLQKRQRMDELIVLLDAHPDLMARNVTLRAARMNADRSRGDVAAIAAPGIPGGGAAMDAFARATAAAHDAGSAADGRGALVALWRQFGVAGLTADLLSPIVAAVRDSEGEEAAGALLDAVRRLPLQDARAVKLRLLEAIERLRLHPELRAADLLRAVADAYDARAPLGRWREAIYGLVNFTERISILHRSARLDTAWREDAARDVLGDVIEAIAERRPFSLIRLGDGEGNFLSYPESHAHYSGPDRDATQCIWWGRPRLSPAEADALGRALVDAVRRADVVGIPELSRLCYSLPIPTPADLFQSWHDFRGQLAVLHNVLADVGRDEADRIFGHGQRLTSCHVHGDLAAYGLYESLFAAAKRVSVVACHPALPERMAELFGIEVRRFIPIPHERKAEAAFGYGQSGEHWPDRFEALRRELTVEEPGEVFVVAAGFLGKLYCDWIKRQGGIALDLGSIVDHWCGFSTRSPFFAERFKSSPKPVTDERAARPVSPEEVRTDAPTHRPSLGRRGGDLASWAGRPTLPGIDLYGSFSETSGLAMGARGLAAALAAAGLDHGVFDLVKPTEHNPRPITLVATNPYVLKLAESWRPRGSLDPAVLKAGFNIAVWAWESASTAPFNWPDARALFDDIWVPSRFTQHCLAQSMSLDTFVVPHAIDVGAPVASRERLGLTRDAFLFCFVFDGLSNPERKNVVGAVRAFRRAFPDGAAELVIKGRGLSRAWIEEILAAAEGDRRVHLRLGIASRADVLNLMASCDAYLSLHRAEGFGLTIAEAMAMGKPVVATGYSGNTDFMDRTTGFPVSYRLVTTDRRHEDYPAGTTWAEPDLDHASRLMRLVRDDPASARETGRAAARRMEIEYSPSAIGKIVRDRIATLVSESAARQASGRLSRAVHRPKERPRVLVLTPVRDAEPHLPAYRRALLALDYPADRLAVAFLEGDSRDGSAALLRQWLPGLRARHVRAELFQYDRNFRFEGPRWQAPIQFERRRMLATVRNRLLQAALRDEDWVLWIDADVVAYPPDTLDRLLAAERDIVTPHCVQQPAGPSFDLNTFVSTEASLDGERRFLRDGIVQPPKGIGRRYLDSFRGSSLVKVDGVGGTMLLVKADLHRNGLVFPAYSHRGYIETEGLAMVARDLGIDCWGMPDLEIVHAAA